MIVPSRRLLWLIALVVVPAVFVLGVMDAPLEILLGVCGVAVLVAAIDAPGALARLRGVSVHLPDLVRTSKGKAFELEGSVSDSEGACPALRLGLPFPPSLESDGPDITVPMAGKTDRVRAAWQLRALERGSFVLTACYVEASSALGLWEGRRSLPCRCEVRVYPDLSRERNVLAPLFFRRGALGMHQVRQLGKGREFEQLRAYLPGDSYDDVYWKGTAKRSFPVTMMYQIERTQEIHVVLDISRRSGRELELRTEDHSAGAARNQCERFIQAALVLALAAEQQGDRCGLVVFSDQVHLTLPAGGGRSHYNACRESLYQLQPRQVSPDFEDLFIHIGNRLRHRSLIIILTDLGEPWLSESFCEAVRQAARRHVVLVHVLGSREFQPLFARQDQVAGVDDLYERLAGHLLWEDLQDTTRKLKQSGVHLTASLQEDLVADVVTQYLNMKKRQLL